MAWDIPNIIINLRKEIEESSGDVSDLETRVGTLESTVSPLPGRITAAEGEIDALQADLDATPVTVTGTTIEIDGAAAIPAESLAMELVPTQSLNGYSKPWAGGTERNILPLNQGDTVTHNGVTYTKLYDDSGNAIGVKANGTAEPSLSYCILYGAGTSGNNLNAYTTTVIPAGTTVYCGDTGPGVGMNFRYTDGTYQNDTQTRTIELAKDVGLVYIQVNANVTVNNAIVRPFICLASETDHTFAPYSNVCPITGKSSVKIETTDGSTTNDAEVTLGATVYAGEIDFNAGTGTSTMANIASYDGETINEPWLSSLDEYTEGGTPTTGAQVVYTLDTPTTVSFTADKLTILEGAQTVTGNGGGDITVSYQKDNLIGDLKKWIFANT